MQSWGCQERYGTGNKMPLKHMLGAVVWIGIALSGHSLLLMGNWNNSSSLTCTDCSETPLPLTCYGPTRCRMHSVQHGLPPRVCRAGGGGVTQLFISQYGNPHETTILLTSQISNSFHILGQGATSFLFSLLFVCFVSLDSFLRFSHVHCRSAPRFSLPRSSPLGQRVPPIFQKI